MRLFVWVIILSGLVVFLFFLNIGIFSKPNPAVISESMRDFTPNEKPIPIKWQGEIFAVIESGNGFAIKKIPEDKENPYILANFRDTERREDIQGKVVITGTWEGMDCSAYQKTVFYGHCAQYILIDQIEKSK